MSKKNQLIILIVLISFSLFCAITLGESWDLNANLIIGKTTLNYLFSLGRINDYFEFREIYSPLYWSLQNIIIKIFPFEYKVQITHIINLTFSFGAIFGISRISKELFNKKVGKIVFLLLFFHPTFFGHMAINSKDTILAFCHVWIFYYLIKYLKNQDNKEKINNYIIIIPFLAALATGIQILFGGTLLPIIFFLLIEIFYFKKFITKNFSLLNFFYDLIKMFFIFYIILMIFWIDAHQNVLFLPYKIILGSLSPDFWTGWPYNLINGEYFISGNVPKLYLLINFIYKTPEFFLFLYPIFLVFFIKYQHFFKKEFKNFNYKVSLILLIIIFPNLIFFFLPYPVYDGMRLFLWFIPYCCIIPALTIHYIIQNLSLLSSKFFSIILSLFFFYFFYNFILITPYQYTYLNIFNGKNENKYKKFENDYWGASINELIKKIDFEKDKPIKFSTCGVNHAIAKKYLLKSGYNNIQFSSPAEADYIIMTNRALEFNGFSNCFDRYSGKDIFKVIRNNLSLSIIRKINNENQ